MKHRFWLFKRRGIFYAEDTFTGKQESLGTRDRKEAERLRVTKNDATAQPFISLAIGKAYLAAHDPPGDCVVFICHRSIPIRWHLFNCMVSVKTKADTAPLSVPSRQFRLPRRAPLR